MGKVTGFLDYDRKNNPAVTPAERLKNFNEFHPPLREADRQDQAARCMNCGIPFCQSAVAFGKGPAVSGCPLHNLIPEWNDEIFQGHYEFAKSRLLKTASFPEFTGRVCPALCEAACTCGLNGDPVTVKENELFVIETAFAKGTMKPQPPVVRTDKQVAIVGSGPAGLAAADMLNKRGHNVTVFEREDRIGGLLMYGIPNMKLEKSIINRRVELMTAEGVEFVTNTNIGVDITSEQLLSAYDAVLLCCGAKKARTLNVGEESVGNVFPAVDFLTQTTKALLEAGCNTETFLGAKGYVSAKNKKVVIVGGGDTGNDCVGTCLREGCASVVQLEMMPQPPVERPSSNPWPEWPVQLKTDYGQEEAIYTFGEDPRVYTTTVKEVIANKRGNVKAVKTVKLNGFEPIDGTEEIIPCDLLLIAAGFTGCEDYTPESFGVARTERGVVAATEGSYATNVDKVFTAGDMRRGQSLVVWAIAEGRNAAVEVDQFLMGYSSLQAV